MTTKKVLGYIFIGLAIILAITIVAQISSVYSTIFGFFKIFTGELDSYEIGEVVGSLIYLVIHFTATILLWKYGRKWTRKAATT